MYINVNASAEWRTFVRSYTEKGYLRVTLDSTRRESERKAIKFFSQEKSYEPRLVNLSKDDATS